jgi:hypothetical protein
LQKNNQILVPTAKDKQIFTKCVEIIDLLIMHADIPVNQVFPDTKLTPCNLKCFVIFDFIKIVKPQK